MDKIDLPKCPSPPQPITASHWPGLRSHCLTAWYAEMSVSRLVLRQVELGALTCNSGAEERCCRSHVNILRQHHSVAVVRDRVLGEMAVGGESV